MNALLNTRVIEVCAMDASMNMQPRDMYVALSSLDDTLSI